jgi:integrase
MDWKKAPDAAREWCGGVNPKILYAAVKAGKLKAARYGAGRNFLFCEAWCTEWLLASATERASRGKAAGHTPEWTAQNALSAASQAVFRAAVLHFHDLRHEAGSRLLEAGWPLHHVQRMLGHASAAQTGTYLNATRIGLQESMRRLDDARCNPVASGGYDRPTATSQRRVGGNRQTPCKLKLHVSTRP